MRKVLFFLGALGLIVFAVWGTVRNIRRNGPASPAANTVLNEIQAKSDLIRVVTPKPNDVVTSPLRIEGEARGFWFFEASFPVRLVDNSGQELGLAIAQAQDEWMTENFVPFQTELEFRTPTTERGTLVFEKDNPSGLPEHADELAIPVRFR
ncbi:MAG: Gmad2 immunoglobulin-like domain-containing protein [Candidatus Sungbacteria bacterium]|uniref:Gmad2 immunoglobulin-like domain-containing protein n=1 Tax=Candidatus Sungiibacteriota bacterium TaxID=2750080 RepID=A0A932YWB8_9BACT|nr:Gmad2 immunoglobulin-like domain-containing protein [Candidatus Sungbacteria bacterium]